MFNTTAVSESSHSLPVNYLGSYPHSNPGPTVRLAGPGETISSHNTQQDATFRLVDGCICLFQTLADGRRQILDVLGPERFFGKALADVSPYSAAALTFTQIETVDPNAERANVEKALRLMLHRSHAHALLLGRKTAQEKVATALLDLSRQFARPYSDAQSEQITFTLYLTRADLADWLGLTFETVSRCVGKLRNSGLIAFSHPEIITIIDEKKLGLLASGQGFSTHTATLVRQGPRQSSDMVGQMT